MRVLTNKRQFLKQFFAYSIVGTSNILVTSPVFAQNTECLNILEMRFECLSVYEKWLQTVSSEPQDYLAKVLVDNELCSILCKSDITQEQFLEINGLFLTKIEAALIAYIGSTFTA